VEHDVGVDDEDGGRLGDEFALRGRVAGGAGDEAAVDVVAEVVLPDDLRRGGWGRRRQVGFGATSLAWWWWWWWCCWLLSSEY
jgi:hypothetical protein